MLPEYVTMIWANECLEVKRRNIFKGSHSKELVLAVSEMDILQIVIDKIVNID